MDKMLSSFHEKLIMDKALVYGDEIELSAGQRSNIKFEFDNIDDEESLEFGLIVKGLTTIIEERYADAGTLITVATGANRLARSLSEEVGIPAIQTIKLGKDIFAMNPDYGLDKNAVLVDDVYTTGKNLGLVSRLAMNHGFSVLGGAVILDRSHKEEVSIEYGEVQLPVHSLIKRNLDTP